MQLASLAHFHIKTLSVLVSSTRGGGSSREALVVVAFHSFRHLLILLFTFLILIPSDWKEEVMKKQNVQHKVAV